MKKYVVLLYRSVILSFSGFPAAGIFQYFYGYFLHTQVTAVLQMYAFGIQ